VLRLPGVRQHEIAVVGTQPGQIIEQAANHPLRDAVGPALVSLENDSLKDLHGILPQSGVHDLVGVLQDRPAALHDGRRPADLRPRSAARLPTCPRQAECGVTMHWPPDASGDTDPRHVFLDAHDVMARYGWGKTKGYQNLKDRELVPPPVMTHPDRWRLDQLLAWEEKRMALAEAALEALVTPSREEVDLIALLPQPKRRRTA